MIRFNNKKKIIIILLIIISIVVIGYYIYINQMDISLDNEEILIKPNNSSNIEENILNETMKDNKNTIIVHVSGAVQTEGIIEIEENSRIINAIEKAGGLKENACINDINLASKVQDEEKIYIPTQEEYNKIQNENLSENNINGTITNKNFEQKTNVTKNNKININTATQSELELLPGIGATTALKIITYRNENGKFKSIEDLKKVKGIGESKFKEIKDLIVI